MTLLQFILVIVACNSAANGGAWGWWVFLACLCGSSK
ncbi:hypothetical protein P1062_0204070 [Pasteurella multocida subsp. multocida P1062]|nr:hypothetical protein P1062_0204070 [Pasteurella multocida subsp. multocida P1062]